MVLELPDLMEPCLDISLPASAEAATDKSSVKDDDSSKREFVWNWIECGNGEERYRLSQFMWFYFAVFCRCVGSETVSLLAFLEKRFGKLVKYV